MSADHAAKRWVEENYPDAPGVLRAALALAYGAGLDLGLAEAQEIIRDACEEAGVILTPLLDRESFDARTRELRARGFAREADARDRYASRG